MRLAPKIFLKGMKLRIHPIPHNIISINFTTELNFLTDAPWQIRTNLSLMLMIRLKLSGHTPFVDLPLLPKNAVSSFNRFAMIIKTKYLRIFDFKKKVSNADDFVSTWCIGEFLLLICINLQKWHWLVQLFLQVTFRERTKIRWSNISAYRSTPLELCTNDDACLSLNMGILTLYLECIQAEP